LRINYYKNNSRSGNKYAGYRHIFHKNDRTCIKPRRSRKHRISRCLRAAGIPARYQFGTIEVGTEQLQNWVGGATKPEAAQQIISQGGIANRGLIEGGRFAKVRMEHVWVQAYVNWATQPWQQKCW
jgi:hypothetical protein